MSDNAQLSIDQVAENANPDWMATCELIARTYAASSQPFSTDDIWHVLGGMNVSTHEPRAMGAVMRSLAHRGVIRATGQYVKTSRKEAHSRPIPLWIGV